MDDSNSFEHYAISNEENCGFSDDDHSNDEEHNIPLIDAVSNQKSDRFSLSVGKIKILKPRRRIKSPFEKIALYYVFLLFAFIVVFSFLKIEFEKINDRSLVEEQRDCDRVAVTSVWNITFPMFTIESAIRLVDVNNDTTLDVIVAFGTGADAAFYPSVVCRVYFNFTGDNENTGCGGGILALEGITGSLLWIQYTKHELFAVNCNHDLTGDTVRDCVVGGRMASLYAINGANGEILWAIQPSSGQPIEQTSNFYTPLYLSNDIDGDKFSDLLVMHGGDPLRSPTAKVRIPARLIFISAKTGIILSWSVVPDGAESYYSPQQITDKDGVNKILFGTGGETHRGSLFLIALDDLLFGEIRKAKILYSDCCKGVMVPPVLIDLNGDSVLDIVMALFNATVIALDGQSHEILWKSHFVGSETYSTPAVGYFNNDSVPDFMVTYQRGPGFPIYHFSEVNILDGRNGEKLLPKSIKMLIGTQSSPLTISTHTGADIFLFWFSSCDISQPDYDIEKNLDSFRIMPGTNVHDASRADFCAIRFNSSLFTKLIAFSHDAQQVVYDSTAAVGTERVKLNFTEIGQKWLRRQNERFNSDDYLYNQANGETNDQKIGTPQYSGYQRLIKKRHVGLHDGDGVQRVISTGTLAPSDSENAIDIVFATYWFPAARNVRRMPKEMQECIDRYMIPEIEANIRLLVPNSKLYGFDHDAYQEFVNNVCRQETKQLLVVADNEFYNPFSREMGSMTVYRKRLRCGQTVKKFEEQMWPSYLGSNADCVARAAGATRRKGS